MMKITAEEFYREKIRNHFDIKGQMHALWKYEINGELAFRWANEFAQLNYNQAIEDAAQNAEVSLFDYIGTSFKEFKQHSEHYSIDDGSYVKVDKDSIIKLKKDVSSTD